MLKWIFGLLFIIGGVLWDAAYLFAAGMADRQVAPAEIIGPLAIGGIAIGVGAVVLIFG